MRSPWTSRVFSGLSVGIASLLALSAACGDNDRIAGPTLLIEPGTGLEVTEGGGTATFTVALASAPAGELTIALASSDASEGSVSPTTLTFTADNFATPITVTVTGVDDDLVDGDQPFVVTLDGGPSGITADVDVTNVDNDLVGITIVRETEMTSEGGNAASFTVVLNTQPTADVVVPIQSANPNEGTPSVDSLTFTTDNWNAPQQVIVTGQNDDVADGPVVYEIDVGPTTSGDAAYNGLDPEDPTFTNVDNDSPGVVVTPVDGLETTEAGATATFTVVLTSQPTGSVILDLSSSDPGEGTVAPARLTFSPVDWNAPQVVTVTGVDDTFDDGDQSFTIETAALVSTDLGYAGIDPPDVAITNIDDEQPGFTITPVTGLVTTEGGGTASFTIVLISEPKADVVVPFSSSDPTEGTPAPASVTFTMADWDVPKTVTVTGVNDDVADGNQPYRILVGPAQSTDPAYDGFDPPDVAVTNTDNDTPGITVTPTTGLLVSELGDSAFFDIVLNSEPTADVTITMAVNDNTEGQIAPTSVTFTPANWNVAQRVTVTGRDDAIADGNQAFQVVTNAATSADPRYAGINPPNVTVTNFDNDAAQVIVDAPPILEVSEAGTSATFTMTLTRMPTANVICQIASQNTNEGTVSPNALTFTPTDWATPKVVTVTGVDDTVDDGDQLFLVITHSCSSTDPQYNAVNPRDVSARNADNDP